MAKFEVQVIERNVYIIRVEAPDSETAVDLAYKAFGHDLDESEFDLILRSDDAPDNSDSLAELVTNMDTGAKEFRA